MKTRYKIFFIIGSFVAFYFALIPVMQSCIDSNNDCTVWKELLLLTRPVITSTSHMWDTVNGIGTWTGTVEEIETTSIKDQISYNLPFVVSMIVLPLVMIGFVVVWDKRK